MLRVEDLKEEKMLKITVKLDSEKISQQEIDEINRHLTDLKTGKLKIREFGDDFALFNKKGYQIGRIYINKELGKSKRV